MDEYFCVLIETALQTYNNLTGLTLIVCAVQAVAMSIKTENSTFLLRFLLSVIIRYIGVDSVSMWMNIFVF